MEMEENFSPQLLCQFAQVVDGDKLPVLTADQQDMAKSFGGDHVGIGQCLIDRQTRAFEFRFRIVAAVLTAIDADIRHVKGRVELNGSPETLNR